MERHDGVSAAKNICASTKASSFGWVLPAGSTSLEVLLAPAQSDGLILPHEVLQGTVSLGQDVHLCQLDLDYVMMQTHVRAVTVLYIAGGTFRSGADHLGSLAPCFS